LPEGTIIVLTGVHFIIGFKSEGRAKLFTPKFLIGGGVLFVIPPKTKKQTRYHHREIKQNEEGIWEEGRGRTRGNKEARKGGKRVHNLVEELSRGCNA